MAVIKTIKQQFDPNTLKACYDIATGKAMVKAWEWETGDDCYWCDETPKYITLKIGNVIDCGCWAIEFPAEHSQNLSFSIADILNGWHVFEQEGTAPCTYTKVINFPTPLRWYNYLGLNCSGDPTSTYVEYSQIGMVVGRGEETIECHIFCYDTDPAHNYHAEFFHGIITPSECITVISTNKLISDHSISDCHTLWEDNNEYTIWCYGGEIQIIEGRFA